MSFGEIITWPFAQLMVKLYSWTGSYGLSVILFALIVNLILTPFMAKSKKSTMKMTRFQPKIAELQKRHEGNPQKLNAEMQKLYREEGVKPLGGCLWSLIPFPILIALYSVIRKPLSRMMFIKDDAVAALQELFVNNNWIQLAERENYPEIKLASSIHERWADMPDILGNSEALKNFDFSNLINLDFKSFGMNLGQIPNWKIWEVVQNADKTVVWQGVGLFLIPFIAAALSYLTMKVGQMYQPQQDNQTQASMKSMTLMMPLMSVWFCFIMPAVMGVYWIANSVFGMGRDYVLTKYYKAKLDKEDAEKLTAEAERARQIELNRLETERKHAEGTSEVNTNTSKKKQKASEKQKDNERKAAIEKEEKAARREQLGIKDPEIPASQVGNRRYARGRAYDPDRFKNETNAAEIVEEAVSSVEETESIVEETVSTVEEAVQSEVAEAVAEQTVEQEVVETAAEEKEN